MIVPSRRCGSTQPWRRKSSIRGGLPTKRFPTWRPCGPDVVRRNPDVIIAIGNNLVLDFKALTTTIPIVGTFARPVESGVVASLARPGGNITGISVDVGWEEWGKRIQLLKQVILVSLKASS